MRFKTEYKIFVEQFKPKNFIEYIGNQVARGSDINLKIKEVFDLKDLLIEAKVELETKLNEVSNHEEEIKVKVQEFEAKIRKEYEDADNSEKTKITNQIEILNKLISDCEAKECAETESEQENEGV